MTYALNISSVDHCRFCVDTGWVELAGTVKHHGVVYSRGSAPCKWCEWGKARYARQIEQRQQPESNFSESDVVVPDDGRPASRQEALAALDQMRQNELGRIAHGSQPQVVKQSSQQEAARGVTTPMALGEEALQSAPPEPAGTTESSQPVPGVRNPAAQPISRGQAATTELPPEPAPTLPSYDPDEIPF